MDPKQQALEYIKNLGATHSVSKAELIAAYDGGAGVTATDNVPATNEHSVGIAEIIYYIGGAIVFIGIAIFVYQNWNTLPFATKVLSTLGAGIAAYVVGVLFGTQEKLEGPSNAFYLISALVMPIGLSVVFDNAGYNVGSSGIQTTISFMLFVMYLASFILYRKPVFALFSIIFGTWLFYASTDYLVVQSAYIDSTKFTEYRALISGLVYILLGVSFIKGKLSELSGALFGFGSLGLLGAALALGGWEPNQNAFWELIYPLLVFGVLYLSVYVKSKSFLTFGTLFLMAYILKITGEYFTQGLGWPVSLIIAGLLMIGVGYLSVTLNKKYIKVV